MKNVLEKILEEIENHAIEFESFGMCDDYVSVGWVKEIIRSHINEVENDERLIKKYVTNRQVVRDFYNKHLYIKGCCPKCGCELKSCETDYCRVCGQALRWDNPEGGL